MLCSLCSTTHFSRVLTAFPVAVFTAPLLRRYRVLVDYQLFSKLPRFLALGTAEAQTQCWSAANDLPYICKVVFEGI